MGGRREGIIADDTLPMRYLGAAISIPRINAIDYNFLSRS